MQVKDAIVSVFRIGNDVQFDSILYLLARHLHARDDFVFLQLQVGMATG